MSALPAQDTDSNKERSGVDDGWAATSAAIKGRQEVRKLCLRAFPALQEEASWVELLLFVSAHREQHESAKRERITPLAKLKLTAVCRKTHGVAADFDGGWAGGTCADSGQNGGSAGGTCADSGPNQKVRRDVAHNTRGQRKTRAWVQHFVWLTTADVPAV